MTDHWKSGSDDHGADQAVFREINSLAEDSAHHAAADHAVSGKAQHLPGLHGVARPQPGEQRHARVQRAKPLPVGYRKAAAKLGVPKNEICTIGDQLFTDILGAKLFGIKSILVPPIEPEKTAFFKIKRAAEKPFLPKKYM